MDRAAAHRPTVAIVGGGPAGLMAAEVLAETGAAVTIYDRMPSLGRKLLMAGRGGLNLTHSEPIDRFLDRYREGRPHLDAAIAAFSPEHLRAWCRDLGQETFVGTSGRVFPTVMKASPLLRAWLRRLADKGVAVALRHRWVGWTADGRLAFETPEGRLAVASDATVLALGGASWPALGSDGAWVDPVRAAGVAVAPLQPANGGVVVPWTAPFLARAEGQPLKSIAISIAGETARGDVVVTASGLEGGPIYALSAPIRDAVRATGGATIRVALRPDASEAALAARLAGARDKQSVSTVLRKRLNLSPPAISLIQEAIHGAGAATDPMSLAALINAVPLRVMGVAPIERAISSAGGVTFASLDADLMLNGRPGVFVAGEMLDWEAPTGGYLLQACLATGRLAGRAAQQWLQRPK